MPSCLRRAAATMGAMRTAQSPAARCRTPPPVWAARAGTGRKVGGAHVHKMPACGTYNTHPQTSETPKTRAPRRNAGRSAAVGAHENVPQPQPQPQNSSPRRLPRPSRCALRRRRNRRGCRPRGGSIRAARSRRAGGGLRGMLHRLHGLGRRRRAPCCRRGGGGGARLRWLGALGLIATVAAGAWHGG